ncbi:hypothetical protein JAAARDRAFT_88975, partial [Jaapia argillacea MUCL 33604]
TSQKCNTFQVVYTIFLHSCNTPDKDIQSLSHLGLGSRVSLSTPQSNVEEDEIYTLGQTFLTSYAYNHFDVQLKSQLPTLQKCSETLAHMTSAVLLRLEHGVTTNNLRCLRLLWQCSTLNDSVCWSMPLPSFGTSVTSISEYPSGLSRCEWFNSWNFRYHLFYHGLKYFHQFRHTLGSPKEVDSTPVVKSHHFPAQAMDINQSEASGNIQVIANLLMHGGVGDPYQQHPGDVAAGDEWNIVNMTDHVILFHGDLGTSERV